MEQILELFETTATAALGDNSPSKGFADTGQQHQLRPARLIGIDPIVEHERLNVLKIDVAGPPVVPCETDEGDRHDRRQRPLLALAGQPSLLVCVLLWW